MPKPLDIIEEYQKKLELPTGSGGLGISAMLGPPAFGRVSITLPLAAVVFRARSPRPVRVLGNTREGAHSMRAILYVYASNESELLDLIDAMDTAFHVVSSVTVPSEPTKRVQVAHSGIERVDWQGEEQQLEFTTMTEVSFTWN